MTDVRKETDGLGIVEVPAEKLWGPQTQTLAGAKAPGPLNRPHGHERIPLERSRQA